MKGKHFKEESKLSLISKILILIFLAIFTYSAYKVGYWVKSNRDLKKLENEVFTKVVQEVPTEENNEESETQNQESAKIIDFKQLLEINKDIIGWISIENTEINYPILQSTNNDYYLKKDIYKKNSSCGSIFLDCKTKADFSEQNTVVYGHHLKSGGMFTQLDKIYAGDLGNEVYIQIYTPETSYKYQVIASYIAKQSLSIVKKDFVNEQRQNYLENAMNKSKVKFKQVTNMQENILTLVTCHGEERTVINAIRVK